MPENKFSFTSNIGFSITDKKPFTFYREIGSFEIENGLFGNIYASEPLNLIFFEIDGKFYRVSILDLLRACLTNHLGG